MLTRIAVMTFGADSWRYWQAHHCLVGLLAHAPRPCEIVVATDHPERFRWFGDAVRVEALDAARLRRWIGPQGYFLRTLVETLRLAIGSGPESDVAVYCDTDTVARRDLSPLVRQVLEGRIAMARREYVLATHRRRGSRRLWEQVGGRSWAGTPVGPGTAMWNTGITAVGRRDFHRVDQALAALDAMLAAGVDHYLTEQIAMSAALDADGRGVEANPAGAEPLIAHYWGNKEAWNGAIARFLAGIHAEGLDLAGAVARHREQPIGLPLVVKRPLWKRILRLRRPFSAG